MISREGGMVGMGMRGDESTVSKDGIRKERKGGEGK